MEVSEYPLHELLTNAVSLNKKQEFQAVSELLSDQVLEIHSSADLYAEKSQALYGLKQFELSNSIAQRTLRLDPNHAKGNHYRANYFSNNKEYEKAKELYSRAIDTDPKFAYPYYGLGVIHYIHKDYEEAITSYEKGIEANPSYSFLYNGLANTFKVLKQHEKAIKCFKKAIELDTSYVYAYYGLGSIYKGLKEYDNAINAFKNAIDVDPDYIASYQALGSVYSDLKDYEKAQEYFSKVIAFNPHHADAYNNLGLINNDLKNYDQAITFYDKAISINADHDGAYYNRAMALFNKEQYGKALLDYQRKVDLTKGNPDYHTSIARSRISEIQKLTASKEYGVISEYVEKIKALLLYREECVTHYTGLSAAKAMIMEGSLMRLSEGAFLNDTSEGTEVFNFLALELSAQQGNVAVAQLFTQKPFIGSFVTEIKHDDLALWRMYAKENKEEANGCAITIDMKELQQSLEEKLVPEDKKDSTTEANEELSFYRVAYRARGEKDHFIIPGAAAEKQKELNRIMHKLAAKVNEFKKKNDTASDSQSLIERLNEIAYLFKSAEYQYEHELRLVLKGIGFKKQINVAVEPPKVYIELVSIRPLIQKITFGPKVEHADEWAAAFYYSLRKENYHPEILISRLPFK